MEATVCLPNSAARCALAAGVLLSLGSVASAGPPVRIRATDQSGRSILHYGKDYVISPPRSLDDAPPMRRIQSDLRLKIFLNFDGAKLHRGGNDSRTNKTNLVLVDDYDYPAMNWSGYGGKEQGTKNVLDELKLLYGNYSVEFVTKRPDSGDYTMVMIGGRGDNIKQGSPGTVGISPLDCKNSYKNDLAIVFGNKIGPSPQKLAYVIAHELGHSFGLEHVSEKRGIMYPGLNSQTCCWVKSSLYQASTCGRGEQDAKKVLSDNLGAGPGDTVFPKVWFVRPGNGAVLPADFTFEVDATDDLRIARVRLFLDGKQLVERKRAPYVASVRGAADGEHTLKAEVADFKPNTVTTEVKVRVDKGCIEAGTCFSGPGGAGSRCTSGSDCLSGICAKKGDVGSCSEVCAKKEDLCPDDTTCQQSEGRWLCLSGDPASSKLDFGEEEGGCSLGDESNPPLSVPLVLLLVLSLVLGRRSRKPRGQ